MEKLSSAQIEKIWKSLKLNESGLIPVIAFDSKSKKVLMHAWMNEESFTQTLETGNVTYFSRSRNELWVKGKESGNTQELIELRIDCDQDTVLAFVDQKGNACHTGSTTCFDDKIVWSRNE